MRQAESLYPFVPETESEIINDFYSEFGVETPEYIFVTSGSVTERISRPDANGETITTISSTALPEPDVRGVTGWGKARMVAGLQVGTDFPDAKLITLSRSTNNTGRYSDAEIMQQEMQRLNREIDVHPHSAPVDLFTEVLESVRIGLDAKVREIAIVTTAFQLPRTQAMLESILNIENPAERAKIEQMLAFDKHRFPERECDHEQFHLSYDKLIEGAEELKDLRVSIIPAESILIRRSPTPLSFMQQPKYLSM